ncbi:integral membrane protein [Lactiplantibacillus plantarum]|nr:integral membrane protein [Lactiplantibacillus plantarum]
MKSKNLALTNGIVGLVGGIILLFGGWFIAGGHC